MCKAYGGEPSVDLLQVFLNLGPVWIDGEFHFLLEGGVGDEGSSISTKFVNNEGLTIDAEPLTAVYSLEVAENIGDSDDAPSKQDEVALSDHTTAHKAQNRRVSVLEGSAPAFLAGDGRTLKVVRNSSKSADGSPLVKMPAYW
ncbi:hypothetical protein Tco_0222230 [Tanacetum coccineum]